MDAVARLGFGLESGSLAWRAVPLPSRPNDGLGGSFLPEVRGDLLRVVASDSDIIAEETKQ